MVSAAKAPHEALWPFAMEAGDASGGDPKVAIDESGRDDRADEQWQNDQQVAVGVIERGEQEQRQMPAACTSPVINALFRPSCSSRGSRYPRKATSSTRAKVRIVTIALTAKTVSTGRPAS